MDIRHVLQVLFPYLAVLYFIDCFTFIGKHNHIFVSSFGNRYRLRSAGFHLAGLSPLCQVVDAQNLPLFLTSEGLYIPADSHVARNVPFHRDDLHFVPYSDLHTVQADGKTIRINGAFTIKAPSPIFSRSLAGRVQKLREAEPQEREGIQRKAIEEMTDMGKLEAMREEYATYLRPFSLLCSVLFLCVFIIVPSVIYLGLEINLLPLLFFVVPAYFLVVAMSYLFYRRFYPSSGEEMIYLLLSVFLLPVSALHVISRLTRQMYSSFDFIAVASLLISKDALRDLMRKELQRIHHAKQGDFSPDLREYWLAREDVVHRLMKRSGFSPEEMWREPARKDRFAERYCPLCDAEYRGGFEICAECSVNLKEYERG